MKQGLKTGCVILTCVFLLTACVGVPLKDFQDTMGKESMVFGFLKVRATGPYSRGYETQLRFFHLLNVSTQERIRVDVQSATKAFGLALVPGDYEVIRVQINEGPMMMESHVSLQFQVRPNVITYLGNWEFDVDTPRTQRMLRMKFSHEPPNLDEIPKRDRLLREKAIVVSLPEPQSEVVSV